MPVQSVHIPTISPPSRSGAQSPHAQAIRAGGDQFRVMMLKRKRADIVKNASNPKDPAVLKRLEAIDDRILHIQGVGPTDRAKLKESKLRQAKHAQDIASQEEKDKRDAAAAARKDKLDNALLKNREQDLENKKASHSNTLAILDQNTSKAAIERINLSDAQAEQALRKKIGEGNVTFQDIAFSEEFMAAAPTLWQDAVDMVKLFHKMEQTAHDRQLKPDELVEMKLGATDYALASLEEIYGDMKQVEQMDPAGRFQAIATRLQRMGEVEDPQLKEVFKTFAGILREVDKGGDGGEGDQQLSDEEMDQFMTRLSGEAEIFMAVRKSLDKARGKGGAADIFGLGTGTDSEYRPSILDYKPRAGGGTAPAPAGDESEQKGYLDELMSKYSGD